MTDKRIVDVLEDSPSNWGKWSDDDECGAVNYLTQKEVLRGIQAVEDGSVFTLGVPIGGPEGEPSTPNRSDAHHHMERDKGHYEANKVDLENFAGVEIADDVIFTYLQGSTHVDALGHVWYDDALYNGFDAGTTKGGLERCGIDPIAERGVVGRGVLLDIARYRGVGHLAAGERITLEEIRDCADEQNISIQNRDALFLRTGWIEVFYENGKEAFFGDEFDEPGVTYSEELVEWFHEREIPVFGTDTLANEQTKSDVTKTRAPLHAALLRDQGILFNEINRLDELAEDCDDDGKYDFMYVCSPLKIVGGTASPVNPIAIK